MPWDQEKLRWRRGPAHVTLETSSATFKLSSDPRSDPLNNSESVLYRKQNPPLHSSTSSDNHEFIDEAMLVYTPNFQLLIHSMQVITLDTKSRVQPKTTRRMY